MAQKQAGSSQAAWALLTEGVTAARIDAHRLRALTARVLQLVDSSDQKEHLYQVAGDLIQSVPRRVESMEQHLDRTSYALAVLGEESLRTSLPLASRKLVDESVERSAPMFGPARKIALDFLSRRADLSPPIGHPGGPCQVIQRVEENVRAPQVRDRLESKVEEGEDLTNPDAASIYDPLSESGVPGTRIKKIIMTPHAQYRADLRHVSIPEVRVCLAEFFKEYSARKSQGSQLARSWEESFMRNESIEWTSKLGLFVAFVVANDTARIITTYWKGEKNPPPPGEDGCELFPKW